MPADECGAAPHSLVCACFGAEDSLVVNNQARAHFGWVPAEGVLR